jgi:glycosyltransferase involved in cell wall biosynthesis
VSSAAVSGAAESGAPAKIVMMVGNDIAHDTRVLKMGLTLADAGLDVTLLGYASSGHREEMVLGKVRILRVPVIWRMKEAAAARKASHRVPHLQVGLNPARRRALDLESAVRRREAESGGGRMVQLRAQKMRARRFVARARGTVDRRLRNAEGEFWRVLDGATHRVRLGADWRRLLPDMDDYELAFGPVLDTLDWDVLHAHDVHMVGVASRAAARRRAQGRKALWVYDAHEYVSGLSIYGGRTIRKRAAYLDLEREYIRDAHAVVTVTQPLAEALQQDYRLKRTPTVVVNSPVLGAGTLEVDRSVREVIGLAPEVPLVVYSGAVSSARGIDTAIEALLEMPEVHLAVVAVPHTKTWAARNLAKRAFELGVTDRVHMLEPVAPDQVAAFVSSADVGILPLLHFGSHEVALANKLFEYLHGGLPLLVSDCKAGAQFVREHNVGRVHIAGDSASFVRELRQLLTELPDVRARIAADTELLTPYAWDRQEAVLRDLYREILGPDRVHEPTESTSLESVHEGPLVRDDRPSVVGIGPANMAGQAWAWAKAIEEHVPGVRTEVLAVDRGSPLAFPADTIVRAATFARDGAWAQRFEAQALEHWTHALLEAGRPIFGHRHGTAFTGDVPILEAVGIKVGLLLHGSEIRNPRRHAESSPWSPFRDPEEELTAKLQQQWDVLHPLVMAFDGPVFVSTPDLLEDVPDAHLLPVVVDVQHWTTDAPVMERERPVVLHVPSRASIKGSAHVDAAMEPLHASGLITYERLEGVAPDQMPALVAAADIVLDQFSLGSYGVMAVQAMAAGRVVVGHCTDQVRAAFPMELPIVEGPPDRLADVIRGLVADREKAHLIAAAGPAFASEIHGGSRSAEMLRDVLGLHGS